MGGYGRQNPYPFQYGGGESDTETTWRALRKAVGAFGEGAENGAGAIGGVEDAFREAKAQVIAAVMAEAERAAFQALPNLATDHIPVYQKNLGVPPKATAEEDRQAIAAAFTRMPEADIPHLRVAIQEISTQADIVTTDDDTASYVHFGKWLAPRTGTPAYGIGAAQSSEIPNYSSHFVTIVEWTLAPSEIIPPANTLADIESHLNEVLPAWQDYTIITGTGFYLDGGPNDDSLMDLTAFD